MTRSAWMIVVVLAAMAGVTGAGLWRAEGDAPTAAGPEAVFLGKAPRSVRIELSDVGSGLRSASASLVHARGEERLAQRHFPGNPLLGGGPTSESLELGLDAEALALAEGDAVLRVELRDWSWRGLLAGNVAVVEMPVTIDLRPPRVRVETGLTYVRQGGASAVAYRLAEPVVRDGVRVGERFHPGVPWPREGCADLGAGESACRVAIFALPIRAGEDTAIRVEAEDRAGNLAAARWATRIQPRVIPDVPITLSDGFLEGKVRDLAERWSIDASDPVAAFHDINTRIRARDEARIQELVGRSHPAPLWRGAFRQLANSKVTSLFAEQRAYRYRGTVVSEATHYGYDLASTAGAPITASNAGRVLFAGDLGIYGDTVLLDHGTGIVSLYGHLSSIDVSEGEELAAGAVLGRSGETGFAGGDHLHFAILVGGIYVDPREWWDPRWVRDHVDARMPR